MPLKGGSVGIPSYKISYMEASLIFGCPPHQADIFVFSQSSFSTSLYVVVPFPLYKSDHPLEYSSAAFSGLVAGRQPLLLTQVTQCLL